MTDPLLGLHKQKEPVSMPDSLRREGPQSSQEKNLTDVSNPENNEKEISLSDEQLMV